MRLTRWPSIVQLAADYAAAIRAAAAEIDWRRPARDRYAELLLALMAKPEVQAVPTRFNNLCDRFERVMGSKPDTP